MLLKKADVVVGRQIPMEADRRGLLCWVLHPCGPAVLVKLRDAGSRLCYARTSTSIVYCTFACDLVCGGLYAFHFLLQVWRQVCLVPADELQLGCMSR